MKNTKQENKKIIQSAPGPGGRRSKREYTREEVDAAKRLGLADGVESKDSLGGVIFWAGGRYYPELVEQSLSDYKVVKNCY